MAKNKTKAPVRDERLKNDIASFKASAAFIIFFMLIFFTSSLQNNRAMYNFRNSLDNNMWVLAIPFAIVAIASLIKNRAVKKNKDESFSYFSSDDFLGLSVLFLVWSLTFTATTSIFMYIMVIIGFAIAYYAKRFFGSDFYAVTLLNLSVAFALWLKFGVKGWSTTLSKTSIIILFIFCALTAIGVTVLTVYGIRAKNNGCFKKYCFIPVFVSLVLGAALALAVNNSIITLLVAEIILLIQYAALGVFYTVRLINQ